MKSKLEICYLIDILGSISRGGGGVLPYKGLMGTCGQPGYVFRDFCLEQGIEFIIFCLNQGINLSIFILNWVKCLKQGIKNRNSVLKWKISDICLKQGQGMRGRAAPPQPGIHRVPPRARSQGFYHRDGLLCIRRPFWLNSKSPEQIIVSCCPSVAYR